MFSKDNFITQFQQLIKALAVAKNGQLNMMQICMHSLIIGLVFKTTKSTRHINLLTRINTSSIVSFGTLIDLSISKRLLEVSFNSPRLSC